MGRFYKPGLWTLIHAFMKSSISVYFLSNLTALTWHFVKYLMDCLKIHVLSKTSHHKRDESKNRRLTWKINIKTVRTSNNRSIFREIMLQKSKQIQVILPLLPIALCPKKLQFSHSLVLQFSKLGKYVCTKNWYDFPDFKGPKS